MAIISNEVREMDKMSVNYLEVYKDYLKGYKQYKEDKQKVETRTVDPEVTAVQ